MRSFIAILLLSIHAFAAAERARPVNTSEYVELGGIPQWITMRGSDARNPVLLVVHGGPGEAQWPLAAAYAPYEKYFVVVQWDQRGAGRTFARNGETPDTSLDRITDDGIELAEHLRKRLNKGSIVVLGHSWGSTVAVRMISIRPELFAAYLGTGQAVSWKASVEAQFAYLLAQARLRGEGDYARELEAIGKPNPTDAQQYFQFSRRLREFIHPADRHWLEGLAEKARSSPEVSDADFQDLVAGMRFSGPRLLKDQMSTDLTVTNTRFSVPFIVIQGEEDIITPTTAVVSYFKIIEAPTKRLILIPKAGHFALLTHSTAFVDVLATEVLPIVSSE